MYVYMYIYTHTHTHYIYTCMYTHTHITPAITPDLGFFPLYGMLNGLLGVITGSL